MNAHNPGRHRTPAGHSLFRELRAMARETAQPALKSATILAATGGLIVSFANSASAEPNSVGQQVGTSAAAPAVVGPAAGSARTANALHAIGFTQPAAPAAKGATAPKASKASKAPKAQVIRDVVVEEALAKQLAAKQAAAKQAAAKKAAAKKAAAERRQAPARASRSTERQSLTTSTAATKSTVNAAPRAASGSRSGSNWATRGQCTWGALNMWYQSEGYYPGGWTGNALAWGSGAARAGYTVSSTPRTRSIVVLQPGVHGSSRSAGHVGWVTAVNGNKVTIVEMNALAGAFNYNTRTLTHVSGMRYIYAP